MDLRITENDLTFFVSSQLELGPVSSPLMDFQATGFIYIAYNADATPNGGSATGKAGFAAYLNLQASGPAAGIPGTSFNASLILYINTFGEEIDYTPPPLVQQYVSTKVVIPGGAPGLVAGTYSPDGPYVVIEGSGTLSLLGLYSLTGAFRIAVDGSGFQMQLTCTESLSPLGTMSDNGSLSITSAGLAGVLTMSISGGTAGLSFSGQMQAEINTGSAAVNIQQFTVDKKGNVTGAQTVSLPGSTFQLFIAGQLNIVGVVTLQGAFELTITSTKIVVYIDGQLSLFGIGLGLQGFAAIYYDSSPGIALELTLSANLGLSLPLFSLSGNFMLSLNTTGVERTETFEYGTTLSVAAHFAEVAVTNVDLSLLGMTFTGSLYITFKEVTLRSKFPRATR
jgi:hypothetical protein